MSRKAWFLGPAFACGTLFLVIFFQNCAGGSSGSAGAQENAVLGSEAEAALTFPYIESGGRKIAYVMGIASDVANLYIPSIDRYALVSIRTGQYSKGLVYYPESNCSGTPYVTGSFGEIGKGVVYIREKYYRVVATNYQTSYYKSYFNDAAVVAPGTTNSCVSFSQANFSGAVTYGLEQVDRPYDFESIAPLKVRYR